MTPFMDLTINLIPNIISAIDRDNPKIFALSACCKIWSCKMFHERFRMASQVKYLHNCSPAHGGGNGGGPDHHRVCFVINRNNNTVVNCEMSSISAKAAIILGLSTSPTRTDSLPQGGGSRQLDNAESVARNKQKCKAKKQFDIVQVIERTKGLHGL